MAKNQGTFGNTIIIENSRTSMIRDKLLRRWVRFMLESLVPFKVKIQEVLTSEVLDKQACHIKHLKITNGIGEDAENIPKMKRIILDT